MRSLLVGAIYSLYAVAQAHSVLGSRGFEQRLRRDVTSDGAAFNGQTVDYIVVGGGNAGLVVAGRLSEDSNVTVAVIEAGTSGYETNIFDSPAGTFYRTATGTQYDYQYDTVPQAHLDGRTRRWPRGKVLGGSTAINGLYLVRASEREHNSWAQLGGSSTSGTWGWPNFLDNMKKSEAFSPPDANIGFDIPYDASSHGTQGPVHHTWSAQQYPIVDGFLQAMTASGEGVNPDPYGGDNTGSFAATSSLNPSNWTRSFARSAYLDPYTSRTNLRVLAGQTVSKVLFEAGSNNTQRATGVQYQASRNGATHTLSARREVILAAGAVGSPQILQLSGVGSSQHLRTVGVQTVIDLEGVGYGLSDHVSTHVGFTPRSGVSLPPGLTGNAVNDSYINSAISYVKLNTLMGNYSTEFVRGIRANLTQIVASYDAPESVRRGYNATVSETLRLIESGTAPIEFLFASVFGGVQIQVALQHALSRGSILINSKSAFDYPSIDPAYGQQQADIQLLIAGLELARSAGATDAFRQYVSGESEPTASINSESGWTSFIRSNAGTELHPMSACPMLPRELGGVVDERLLVYGTENLRIVDSSVPPAPMSTHLMTVVYGMAEIAADIIKAAARDQSYMGMPTTRAQQASSRAATNSNSTDNGNSRTNNGSTSPSQSSASSATSVKASMSSLAGVWLVLLAVLGQ